MTYRELLEELKELPPDQLNMDVTIYCHDTDEYYPADLAITNIDDEFPDDVQPFFANVDGYESNNLLFSGTYV